MTQPTISDLSATASSNTDFNGVGILGTDLLSTADDAQRSLGAMLAGYSKDLAGIGQTVGGTANAITLTVAQPWTALSTGLRLAFKNTGGPNTTAVTLAVTNSVAAALGTKAIRLQGDSALAGGEMLANGTYLLKYDASYNAAAGAWVLLNPAAIAPGGGTMTGPLVNTGSSVGYTPLSLISTEAAAAAGPIVDLYRNSASPAANDVMAELDFNGQNSTPAKKTYASIRARIDDATAASEDATLVLAVMSAGTLTDYVDIGANAAGTATADAVGLRRGQLSFPASQNTSSDANTLDDYAEITWTPVLSFGGASTGITYGTQYGRAIKIGAYVWVTCTIILTSKGSSTGSASIAGLPYTSDSTSNVQFALSARAASGSMASLVAGIIGTINANSTSIVVGNNNTTGNPQSTDTNFTNAASLSFEGAYRV